MSNGDSSYCAYEAQEALTTADVLLRNGRYLECGFFCHLAVEKMLKSLVAASLGSTPPRFHTLWRLAELCGVAEGLRDEFSSLVADLSAFQIEGRYPTDRSAVLGANPPEWFFDLYDNTKGVLVWLSHRQQ